MNNAYDRSLLIGTGIYDYLELMQRPCSDNDAQCAQTLCYLLPVLIELATVFDNGFHADKEAAFPYSHDILEYINHNIATALSVDLLCEKFYLTRSQLYRNFKKATGVNPWEYITLKRLMLARSYISDGMSAGSAAIACGFGDYSAFYRAYIKHFGCTPTGNTI
jgi:AraC-like DNA-binding protein